MSTTDFDELLGRYTATPPHALLLTSRRFGGAAETDDTSEDDVEGSSVGDAGTDDYAPSLLSGAEIASIGGTLCGLTLDPKSVPIRHPDLYVVDRTRRQLRIEEIAPIFGRICYPPMTARRRLIIIERAQRLTPYAANALLKSVEEPAASVLFVLTAPSAAHVMPTIVSRCIRLPVPAGSTSPRACDRLDAQAQEVLRQIVHRLARSPLESLLAPQSGRASAAPLGALGEALGQAESLARAATPDIIIAALLELVARERADHWQQAKPAEQGFLNQGTAWLVERLRQWQRVLDYNPSTVLRLTELVVAAYR